MKFFLNRLLSSLEKRVRSWVGFLRSWPVFLRGGRRLWSTWLWLPTMFEKRAWSACSHSSDKGAWEIGRRPSLTALLNDWLQSLFVWSVHEPPPKWRSVQQLIDQCGLSYVPQGTATQSVRFQDFESKKGLGTSTDQVVNMWFKREMVLKSYTQDHHLTHSLYSLDGWQVGFLYVLKFV